MYRILKSILREGVEKHLAGNEYANGLLNRLIIDPDFVPDPLSLSFIKPEAEMPRLEGIVDTENQDLRFRELRIKGIRAFPAGDAWYRVGLEVKCKPVSCVFLGNNGVGKSSLYASLEYISMGHSYLADERGYGNPSWSSRKTEFKQRQKEYLKNVKAQKNEDSQIELDTAAGCKSVTLADEVNPMAPPAFFCSEYDIQTISHEGISSAYLSEQFGLKRYHDLLLTMNGLKKEYDDIIDKYRKNKLDDEALCRQIKVKESLIPLSESQIRSLNQDLAKIANILKIKERDFGKFKIKEGELDEFKGIISWFLDRFQEHGSAADDRVLIRLKDLLAEIDDEKRKMQEEIKTKQGEEIAALNNLQRFVLDLVELWKQETDDILRKDMDRKEVRRAIYIKELSELRMTEARLSGNIRDLEEKIPLLRAEETYVALFNSTCEYLRKEYIGLLKQHIETLNQIMPKLLKKYYGRDIKNVEAKVDEENFSISVILTSCSPEKNTGNGDERWDTMVETNPRLFLNTFRFKMFCFALKFSFACCIKKFHNVNFPMVIDDVFDSSDFANRSGIGTLVDNLIDTHEVVFGEELRLQIIFFTQDNLIADNMMEHFDSRTGLKYSRLFKYYEAGKEDTFPIYDKTLVNVEDILCRKELKEKEG